MGQLNSMKENLDDQLKEHNKPQREIQELPNLRGRQDWLPICPVCPDRCLGRDAKKSPQKVKIRQVMVLKE